MCQTCRQHNLDPEFEAILHNEEEVLAPEMEWGFINDTIKKFTSPFFNWIGGSTKISAPPPLRGKQIPAAAQQLSQQMEQQMISKMISSGGRDENKITNAVFYQRHRELGGKPLSPSQPNYASLSKEWLTIREMVRMYLKQSMPSTPTSPVALPLVQGSGKLTLQNILNAMNRKGYVVYQEPYRLNIVGVRVSNAVPDKFDDSINVFYKDSNGNWKFTSYIATTDPGKKYLNTPINPNGTAILKPGQYINSHKLGLHRGEYTALVQQGKLTVIRDTNKDSTLDFNSSKEETGYFGINVHHATDTGISQTVGGWSAGCQVFAGASDFAGFIALCKQHSSKYGNNFTYTLLLESDL